MFRLSLSPCCASWRTLVGFVECFWAPRRRQEEVYESSARQGMEEEAGGNIRQRENRHSTESGEENLEKRVEELEKELFRLVKVVRDRGKVIEKLKEEIELLNLDLDEFEDENEQLKQENKTLLKVVGQLTM